MLIAANSALLLPSHALSVLSTPATGAVNPEKPNLKESQGKLIIETYQRCHGNVMHTAKELAVSRNTVYRELRRSGVRYERRQRQERAGTPPASDTPTKFEPD